MSWRLGRGWRRGGGRGGRLGIQGDKGTTVELRVWVREAKLWGDAGDGDGDGDADECEVDDGWGFGRGCGVLGAGFMMHL